jgi:hypothetical protein
MFYPPQLIARLEIKSPRLVVIFEDMEVEILKAPD